MSHKFPYRWRLSDGYPAKDIEYHGCKVFGTFICGGGSSMGYKLAGFDHIGGVELDPAVAAVYKANHHPKHLYVEDIRDFNRREDLPEELYQLDILDGSPPCSTFSTAGSREKAWGKEKRFSEGQKLQTLDDLVFVYCDTIRKLMPKVCLLENVSGLVKGNAKSYAKRICQRLDETGYNVQLFLLNAATMGVPQRRERVFFIGLRKDFKLPKLKLDFNEEPIKFGEVLDNGDETVNMSDYMQKLWKERTEKDTSFGDIIKRKENRESWFTIALINKNQVPNTIVSNSPIYCYDMPRKLNNKEILQIGSFPLDYECDKVQWFVGMSVPPVMTAQISHQIYLQWLSKING